MGELFGWRYGMTRYVLGILARLGRAATITAGVLAPNSWYGRLRNMPWKYEDEKAKEMRQRRSKRDGVVRAAVKTCVYAAPVIMAGVVVRKVAGKCPASRFGLGGRLKPTAI